MGCTTVQSHGWPPGRPLLVFSASVFLRVPPSHLARWTSMKPLHESSSSSFGRLCMEELWCPHQYIYVYVHVCLGFVCEWTLKTTEGPVCLVWVVKGGIKVGMWCDFLYFTMFGWWKWSGEVNLWCDITNCLLLHLSLFLCLVIFLCFSFCICPVFVDVALKKN